MATDQKARTVADVMYEEDEISAPQLAEIQNLVRETGKSPTRIMLEKNYITEEQRVQTLELDFGFRLYDLSEEKIDIEMTRVVPRRICAEQRIFPIAKNEEGKLILMMEDPTDRDIIKVIQKKTRMRVHPVVARSTDLAILLRDGPDAFTSDYLEHTPIIPITRFEETERSNAFKLGQALFSPLLIFGPMLVIGLYFFLTRGAWERLVDQHGQFNTILALVMGGGVWIILVLYVRTLLFPTDDY